MYVLINLISFDYMYGNLINNLGVCMCFYNGW